MLMFALLLVITIPFISADFGFDNVKDYDAANRKITITNGFGVIPFYDYTLAEYKLRKVIRTIPKREKEVQDAFENLLVGADIPYQREHPHIAYSSKKYIPDFSFERIDLAIDMKLCAKDLREKQIIAEMNDDIMAYKTKFGNIAFFIYDIGMIRDVERFTAEFSQSNDIFIRVIKKQHIETNIN